MTLEISIGEIWKLLKKQQKQNANWDNLAANTVYIRQAWRTVDNHSATSIPTEANVQTHTN